MYSAVSVYNLVISEDFMKEITSGANAYIKELSKLKDKKARLLTGTYLIEGFHLVEEALANGVHYEAILGTSSAFAKLNAAFSKAKSIQITDAIAAKLSSTRQSQAIFMVVNIDQPKQFDFAYGKWVLLDHLADPGNVGTIIRTADAAGFDGVILSDESVDLYNPKVQRSMQGSQFHLKIIKENLPDAIAQFHEHSIPVLASVLDEEAKTISSYQPLEQLALVIGNEAHGVSNEVVSMADNKIYIPIKGKAESLNAAVAAGIMIYYFS